VRLRPVLSLLPGPSGRKRIGSSPLCDQRPNIGTRWNHSWETATGRPGERVKAARECLEAKRFERVHVLFALAGEDRLLALDRFEHARHPVQPARDAIEIPVNEGTIVDPTLAVVGDFSMTVIGIRQDVTYKVLDQAVINRRGRRDRLQPAPAGHDRPARRGALSPTPSRTRPAATPRARAATRSPCSTRPSPAQT
jgi:hypothetical protein